MNANEMFEVQAEAFRLMTGHLAPGKDMGAMGSERADEERRAAYKVWCEENGPCVAAMMIAFQSVTGRTE